MKYNASLKNNRREKSSKNNLESAEYGKPNFKKVSKKELHEITKKIQKEATEERRLFYTKVVIFSTLFLAVILSIFIYFF